MARVALLVYVLALVVCSILPPGSVIVSNTVNNLPGTYYTGHVLAYALLTAGIIAAFAGRTLESAAARAFRAGLIALAFGIAIEMMQLMIPWRTAKLTDILMNIIGISLSAGVFVLWKAVRGAPTPSQQVPTTSMASQAIPSRDDLTFVETADKTHG